MGHRTSCFEFSAASAAPKTLQTLRTFPIPRLLSASLSNHISCWRTAARAVYGEHVAASLMRAMITALVVGSMCNRGDIDLCFCASLVPNRGMHAQAVFLRISNVNVSSANALLKRGGGLDYSGDGVVRGRPK